MVNGKSKNSMEDKKFYVLLECGWEYNDEIMFRPQSRGGNPKLVFSSESKARSALEEKNLKHFKELFLNQQLHEYAYSYEDLIKQKSDMEAVQALFNKMFGASMEDWWESHYDSYSKRQNNYNHSKVKSLSISDSDWKKLYSHFKLSFWELVAVQKG